MALPQPVPTLCLALDSPNRAPRPRFRNRGPLSTCVGYASSINEVLADLAEMGVCKFEYDGPAVSCRPAGRSSVYEDSFAIYSAALVQPGGIGAAMWSSCEYSEGAGHFYSEPIDLRSRFVAFDQCPGPVKALVILHAGKLLDGLMA